MRFATLFLVFAGCGGTTPQSSVSAPPVASKPAAAAPAPAAGTAAPAAAVGPDGPAELSAPTFTVDPAKVDQGKAVFDAKGCGACHQFGTKLVGPDLNGIGERRTPTWIAKMIKHPHDMVQKDPAAHKLFGELMVEMSDQGVADEEVGPLVSFLVSHPSAK